ncbi:hypothetical protein H7X87_00720 [Acetobacteraceae bacterium]|nr:hypothetical protein [Candidatus Parcubacteria bacterium]
MDVTNFLNALGERAKRRAQYSPPLPEFFEQEVTGVVDELDRLLEQEGDAITTKLVDTIRGDCTVTRIYVSDFKGTGLSTFFRTQRPHDALVHLRAWTQHRWGGRIAVEGDLRSSGIFFEFT